MARRIVYGPPLYLIALVLSFVSFVAVLVVYVIIGVIYTLPGPEDRVLRRRHKADAQSATERRVR